MRQSHIPLSHSRSFDSISFSTFQPKISSNLFQRQIPIKLLYTCCVVCIRSFATLWQPQISIQFQNINDKNNNSRNNKKFNPKISHSIEFSEPSIFFTLLAWFKSPWILFSRWAVERNKPKGEEKTKYSVKFTTLSHRLQFVCLRFFSTTRSANFFCQFIGTSHQFLRSYAAHVPLHTIHCAKLACFF